MPNHEDLNDFFLYILINETKMKMKEVVIFVIAQLREYELHINEKPYNFNVS